MPLTVAATVDGVCKDDALMLRTFLEWCVAKCQASKFSAESIFSDSVMEDTLDTIDIFGGK